MEAIEVFGPNASGTGGAGNGGGSSGTVVLIIQAK